jgi:hypothetical protein
VLVTADTEVCIVFGTADAEVGIELGSVNAEEAPTLPIGIARGARSRDRVARGALGCSKPVRSTGKASIGSTLKIVTSGSSGGR